MYGLKVALACGVFGGSLAWVSPAWAQQRDFDLPAMPANKAIQTFAQQAGVDVIAPGETLRGVTTNPVKGTADVHDALDQMLRGTPLEARKSGERTYLIKAAPQRPQKIAYTAPPAPVAAVAAAPAIVEEAPARSGAGLSEIIVTAQKREESLQDTPISIAVMSADDLQNRGIGSLSDLSTGAVPSLRVTPTAGRPSSMTVTMRGISPGDATQISRDPTVGIYVDGVYLGRVQGLGSELFDLERIEILRGPQGTLFGRNAVGGAISMVSKRPTGELGLDVTAGISNWKGRSIRAHLNLPEIAGFKIKLDGLWNKRDGWVKNPLAGASDWYDVDRRGGRVSVLWQPAPNFELYYSFDTSRDNSVIGYTQIGDLLKGAAPLPPIFSVEDKRVRKGRAGVALEPSVAKVSGHSLQAKWDITDNLTLRSITAYRKLSQEQYDNNGMLLRPYAPNGTFSRLSYADVNQDQFSQEIQFLGSFDNLQFILGGFYFKEDADDLAFGPFSAQFNSDGTGYTLLPVVLGGASYPDRAADVFARSKAIFGQATYTPPILDERLHLTAGLRWTHDRRYGSLTRARGAVIDIPFRFASKRIDPAFTVAFDWTDAVNTYVKWGRAYRAGGANSRSVTYRPFAEEQVSTWEIGAKTELFDRRVRFNIAAYHTRYSGRQVDFVNPANPSNYETLNTPKPTTIKGLDVDLTARIATGLTLSGSYSFTDWEAAVDVNPFSMAIQRGVVLYTPKHSASLALDHEFSPFAGAVLATHFDAVYSSSFYTGGSTSPTTGAYAMLNGRITLRDLDIGGGNAKLALSLWGKNLTNAEFRSFQVAVAGPGLANINNVLFNEPRTYGLEARITF